MIYEGTIQFTTVDKNGNDKIVSEKYILDNVDTFTEVEDKLVSEFSSLTGMDVTAIRRSQLKEIVNVRETADESIYLATLQDVFLDEDGNEKYTEYKVVLFASSMDDAYSKTKNHIKQGYDLSIVGIRKTKFIDVL